MSLVDAIGSLGNYTVFAAVAIWVGVLKFRGAGSVAELWYTLTAGLRAKSRLLPPIAAVVGWLIGLIGLIVAGAGIAMLLWIFVIPVLAIWQMICMGAPLTFLRGMAALIGRNGGSVEANSETFRLPMNVNKSDADDVSMWTSSAVPVPRRSLLTLGASGSGKSETLKWFVDQLQSEPNEPVIVYDHKTDYQDFLESQDVDMIKLSSGGSTDENGSAIAWNVFEEMETEADADEIARALFPDTDNSAGDDFFVTAPRQLFAANLKYLDREIDNPTNATLVNYWQRATPEKMHENLTRDGHEDLTAASAAIDPDASKQSIGVFANAQQHVQDLFTGDFAAEGDFSVREYMENPDGRVLVLDYPTRQSETIAPIFRFLIDESIKHGMDDPHRPAYYLLDEIEHMGVTISRLDELINVGRGNQCQCILSLQSVAQLQDTYGTEKSKALLSGMTTSVILRTADEASVDYARETVGTEFNEYTKNVEKSSVPGGGTIETNRETKQEEEHHFAKGELRSFDPGEAIVARQGKGWVQGRIQMLKQ
ncbi:type IV secretory system conjugative DNA transfer family protein [Halalkalicoccus subterraneus]|uniref:type IV secretory system conjugative DNA transfer family protein n=1 Tax=Halalkalicoccus subterraneus TaxID=2675002 RepID=UPI001FE79612|nr:type IV secretion system DNA-binding domain-containing protein [Halalkalicoccus subterraneus]